MAGLQLTEQTIESIRKKAVMGALVTGIFSIAAGLAVAVFVFVYKGHHPIEFTLFLVVMALIFIFAGIGFIRSAGRGRNV